MAYVQSRSGCQTAKSRGSDSGVINTCQHIGPGDRWVFLQDVVHRIARREKLKDGLSRDARPGNDRPAIADLGIDDNSINPTSRVPLGWEPWLA